MAENVTTLATRAADWSEDQRALIKRTVAPDATNDELAMFLHVAKKAGLDPLQKQIWFVKRKQNVGTRENPKWEDRVTIQAGVDGLQARALRMCDCEGIQSAAVYAKDDFAFDKAKGEVVRHLGNPFGAQGDIVGAWAIVKRTGKLPFVALVRYSEYADDRSFLWKNKPSVMIEKVARSTALRRAYPEDFAGIYDPAEMGKDGVAEAHDPQKVIEAEIVHPPALDAPPEADKREAPRQEAPKAVEAPRKFAPPVHVVALWNRLVKAQGGNKKLAEIALAKAATDAGVPKHSAEWTPEHVSLVEAELWPADVP